MPWKTVSPRNHLDQCIRLTICDTLQSHCILSPSYFKNAKCNHSQKHKKVACICHLSLLSMSPGQAEPVLVRRMLRSLYCGCNKEPKALQDRATDRDLEPLYLEAFSATVEAAILQHVSRYTWHPYSPHRPWQAQNKWTVTHRSERCHPQCIGPYGNMLIRPRNLLSAQRRHIIHFHIPLSFLCPHFANSISWVVCSSNVQVCKVCISYSDRTTKVFYFSSQWPIRWSLLVTHIDTQTHTDTQ